MKRLLGFIFAVPAFGQVAVTIQPANQAALPGSVRRVYAEVQGTPNLLVKWKVTGGCTLASTVTDAAPQIVTAPEKGSVCSYRTKAPH